VKRKSRPQTYPWAAKAVVVCITRRSQVRILPPLSNRNCLELSIEAEKYIETVSFPHRNRLDGLLHQIREDIRDGFFVFTD
jgi:hypothetical protein